MKKTIVLKVDIVNNISSLSKEANLVAVGIEFARIKLLMMRKIRDKELIMLMMPFYWKYSMIYT